VHRPRWMRFDYAAVKAACDLRAADIAGRPNLETARLAIDELERKLDRAAAVLASHETKAGVVIAAVVTVAAVIVATPARDPLRTLWTLVGAALATGCALVSVGLAVLAMLPQDRGNGPDPADMGPALGKAPMAAVRDLFASLDLAVSSVEALTRWKAQRIGWSMVSAAVAFVGLVLFVIAGGTSS
jgi:hypothetical protein